MSQSDREKLTELCRPKIPDELWRLLCPLKSVLSFMNTGAHPDDETTSMLAALALRDGIQVSHACANRGEGGQNAIGTESGAQLGAVRTREMERAAEVIGMTQYWLSERPGDAIDDFGFSKSGDETLENWGEEHTLARFVRILRRERPDIVCPTFLDIPGQHGHHQAMTRSAFKAVEMAADENAFPDQGLPVWQVKKLYLPAWSGAGDAYDDDVPPPKTTVQVDASGTDPIQGADYAQIAQYSRSFHRTQAMGRWVDAGQDTVIPLHLVWEFSGKTGGENAISDGLPVRLGDLADFAGAPELAQGLQQAQSNIDQAIAAWPDVDAIGRLARAALQTIDRVRQECPEKATVEIDHRLAAKRRQLARVIFHCCGVVCRLSLSENEVRAGDEILARLELTAPGLDFHANLILPMGWTATPWQNGECRISVGRDEPVSNPYPDTWFPDRPNGRVHVELSWMQDDMEIMHWVDAAERLQILPANSARLLPDRAIINLADPRPVIVAVDNRQPPGSEPALSVRPGLTVQPHKTGLEIIADNDLAAGIYDLPLTLQGKATQQVFRMQHDHTGATNLCTPATLTVRALDVVLPKGRFAYIGGGNDQTDHWLRQLGLPIVSLDAQAIGGARFEDFDSILIGIFAFRANPALANRLGDLHSWVRDGGNLVTLYHRPWDNWDPERTALARLEIGKPSIRWRVTDQNAAVTHLLPEHPLLNIPNVIGQDDWQEWHKERGLYFAKSWDAAYGSLLAMSDEGEAPLRGALLTGDFGKGRHSHTSLILHHQVEHLVPGAFRLLANLLLPVNGAQR